MNGLWIWVVLLFALLLGFHWRYAWRGRKNAEQQWQQVQEALCQRHALLGELVDSTDAPPALVGTVKQALTQVSNRRDERLKQLRQRCALEFRLAAESRQLIAQAPPDKERAARLLKLDRSIQSALAFYEIAGRSYNRRLEGFPGAVVAMLGGFSPAPELKIEPVLPPYD